MFVKVIWILITLFFISGTGESGFWTLFSRSGDEIIVCIILKYIPFHFQSRFMICLKISLLCLWICYYLIVDCLTVWLNYCSLLFESMLSLYKVQMFLNWLCFSDYLVLRTHILYSMAMLVDCFFQLTVANTSINQWSVFFEVYRCFLHSVVFWFIRLVVHEI
jgi:hypothetical protein